MSQPAYSLGKPKEDHSRPVKRGTGATLTPTDVPQDSHATVKAIASSPVLRGTPQTRWTERLKTTPPIASPRQLEGEQLPMDGHGLTKTGKRTNGPPTAC
jgi:hypothetical protein